MKNVGEIPSPSTAQGLSEKQINLYDFYLEQNCSQGIL